MAVWDLSQMMESAQDFEAAVGYHFFRGVLLGSRSVSLKKRWHPQIYLVDRA
jgi:hypothetical protein